MGGLQKKGKRIFLQGYSAPWTKVDSLYRPSRNWWSKGIAQKTVLATGYLVQSIPLPPVAVQKATEPSEPSSEGVKVFHRLQNCRLPVWKFYTSHTVVGQG